MLEAISAEAESSRSGPPPASTATTVALGVTWSNQRLNGGAILDACKALPIQSSNVKPGSFI